MAALRDDTIAALSTPPGEGAIALLRISGPDALSIAAKIFTAKSPVSELQPRKMVFGKIGKAGETVDEGMLCIFPAPASATGENVAEISCHGGILLTRRVLELALSAGARHAEAGEFTQRAFLNGKMDLTQSEAVMDLIQARSSLALKAAANQLQGNLGRHTMEVRGLLLNALAHLEAFIDFPEEGIAPDDFEALQKRFLEVIEAIDALLATADEGRILREGVKLVICGAPNTGKSSLLNLLLGHERAIVSEQPGTTRDTIEESLTLRGIPFLITDTAGIRETKDSIEQEGIRRTRQSLEQADLALHVFDATAWQNDAPPFHPQEILVINKIDLISSANVYPETALRISCKTGEGLDLLVEEICRRVGGGRLLQGPSSVAINARHQACLKKARAALDAGLKELKKSSPPELVAIELHAANDALGEIVGAADTEEILGRIFSTFCIGK
ncbi:MAG: tRNA uridine-5-carboxymethylaminomethyl(34) synthesis GTPase MnmE [Chthoniobacterales bacterium]